MGANKRTTTAGFSQDSRHDAHAQVAQFQCVHVSRVLALLAAGVLVAALAACSGVNPVKQAAQSDGSTTSQDSQQSSDSEDSQNAVDDKDAGQTTEQTIRFDTVQTYNGTTYLCSYDVVCGADFLGSTAEDAEKLVVPGTTATPLAGYFAFYEGNLLFTELIHVTDVGAANVPLYTANADGTDIQPLVPDVAAETRPVIVGDTLYYVSYDYKGTETYTFDATYGGTLVSGYGPDCTMVVKAYNLKTAETTTYDGLLSGSWGMLDIAGAFGDELYLSVWTSFDDYDDRTVCLKADFSATRDFSEEGRLEAVDGAGHVVTLEYSDSGKRVFRVYEADGTLLNTQTAADVAFLQGRYEVCVSEDGRVDLFDTVTLKPLISATLKDNYSTWPVYYYYDAMNACLYWTGEHAILPGTFPYDTSSGIYISVFSMDATGQVRRVVADPVVWRRAADWQAPEAYVLQWSEIDFYTYDQLNTLSNEELFYGRNEIYYSHGYTFDGANGVTDADLQAFFAAKSWTPEQTGTDFTEAERENLALIRQIEKERNSPYASRGFQG